MAVITFELALERAQRRLESVTTAKRLVMQTKRAAKEDGLLSIEEQSAINAVWIYLIRQGFIAEAEAALLSSNV